MPDKRDSYTLVTDEDILCCRKDEDKVKDKVDESEEKFNAVRELNKDNFETTLAEIEHSLVMFYAPCKYAWAVY